MTTTLQMMMKPLVVVVVVADADTGDSVAGTADDVVVTDRDNCVLCLILSIPVG